MGADQKEGEKCMNNRREIEFIVWLEGVVVQKDNMVHGQIANKISGEGKLNETKLSLANHQ